MPYLYEAIGFAASLLISASLCMSHIKSLRLMNLIGSLFFIVYGILISRPPIIILNFFSTGVNLYYLIKMRNDRSNNELFDVLFAAPEDDLVRRFVIFHKDDIRRFFPSFNPDPENGSLNGAECCFILRETLPVSLVAFKRGQDDELRIVLDYAISAYRDMKNAVFFFNRVISRLANPGAVIIADGEVPAHAAYLRKLGFIETGRDGKILHFRRAV
jgi:hypothetical protein